MAGMKIPIDINLQQVRKSFREMTKLQKKTWRVRQQQIRIEKKESKEELKRIAKEHKAKQKYMKEESTHTKRLRDDRGSYIKREETFTRKNRQEQSKDYRTTTDRIRKIDKQTKGGAFGRVNRAGGAAAAMIGGGILGFAVGYGLKAAEMRRSAMQSFSPAIGTGESFGGIMKQKSQGRVGNYKGGNLGYNVMERSGMIPGMTRATGSTNVVPMMEAMRATGMNQGEVGGAFGAMAAGGTSFSGKGKGNAGKREFKELLAAGMASGLEKGRMPEFMSGVTQLMQTQQAMAAGDVASGGISKLAAALGQSGLSGFKGQRGMALMGKIQQGILQPGGGESGMAFMRQAFGFGKPGGGASFYDAEKKREGGLGKNAEGFATVMGELKSQYGTGEDAVLKMREVLGTSISQGEELIRLSEAGNMSTENLARIDEIMKETEPIEKQAARAMKEAGTTLKSIAARMDQSVGNGAAAQKMLDKIENFQKMLYELMLKWLPKIAGILADLKVIFEFVFDHLKKAFPVKAIIEGASNVINGKEDIKKATAALTSGGRSFNKKYKGVSIKQLQDMSAGASGQSRVDLEKELADRGNALLGVSVAAPGAYGAGQTRANARSLAKQATGGTELYEAALKGMGVTHATASPQQRADARTRANLLAGADSRKARTSLMTPKSEREAAARDMAETKRTGDITPVLEGGTKRAEAIKQRDEEFARERRSKIVVEVHEKSGDPGTVKNGKSKGKEKRLDAGQ